jgi:large-conductance mechanosensitive channel
VNAVINILVPQKANFLIIQMTLILGVKKKRKEKKRKEKKRKEKKKSNSKLYKT